MRKILAFALLGLLPLAATAQDDDSPTGFSYVTYYVCDSATQRNLDHIVEANEYALLDKWVDDGKLIAWGYLSHFTGGRWRRAQYLISPTLDDAFVNQAEAFRESYEDNRDAAQARAEACEGHDDYIWASNQGSGPGTARGDVSLSVYFVCSVADQDRADEIFAETYAPIFEKMQQDGSILSWSWQSHILGGTYRRLQTVTGTDHAEVARARVATIREVNETYPELGREFDQICYSHEDYLWDIIHEAP